MWWIVFEILLDTCLYGLQFWIAIEISSNSESSVTDDVQHHDYNYSMSHGPGLPIDIIALIIVAGENRDTNHVWSPDGPDLHQTSSTIDLSFLKIKLLHWQLICQHRRYESVVPKFCTTMGWVLWSRLFVNSILHLWFLLSDRLSPFFLASAWTRKH